MKKIVQIITPIAFAALFASCTRSEMEPAQPESGRIPVVINSVLSKVGFNPGVSDDGSKIYTPVWQDGDKIAVFSVGAATNANEPFSVMNIDENGVAGNFSGALTVDKKGGAYSIYAIHPYLGEDESNTNHLACLSEIPSVQHPTTSSIDTKSYVSVSYPIEGNIPENASGLEVNGLMFKRITAPLVLEIISSSGKAEKVKEVELKAGNKVTLAGKFSINLENGEMGTFSSQSDCVTAVYSAENAPEVGHFDSWFMVNPQTLQPGMELEVTVRTENAIYKGSIFVQETAIELKPDVVTRIGLTVTKEEKETWADVTSEYKLPANMTVYKTTNLHKRDGNNGYVVKISSGQIEAKSYYDVYGEKTWFMPNTKLSDVVKANPTYDLFVTGLYVQYFKPIIRSLSMNGGVVDIVDDSKSDGTSDGLGKAYPWFHWNTKYYTCPPTLGIKDGKASIAYADVMDGDVLMKFDERQHGSDKASFAGGTPWPVDCAFSGYSLPLKDGQLQIAEESEEAYKALAEKERIFTFDKVKGIQQVYNADLEYNGEIKRPLDSYKADGLRMARTLMGVNAEGDIFIFVSERYSTRDNKLIDPEDPSTGSTLLEAAVSLKDSFGCTDAMSLHFVQFAVVSMQDGSDGTDLTRTFGRLGETEVAQSHVIMFKGASTEAPAGYGKANAAGLLATEKVYGF